MGASPGAWVSWLAGVDLLIAKGAAGGVRCCRHPNSLHPSCMVLLASDRSTLQAPVCREAKLSQELPKKNSNGRAAACKPSQSAAWQKGDAPDQHLAKQGECRMQPESSCRH